MQPDPTSSVPSPEGPWVRNELGIYLPRKYAQAVQQPPLPRMFEFTVLTVEWSALTGTQPTIQGVLDRLRKYSLREILSLVTRITLTLELADDKAGLIDPATQDRLLTNLLGENAMRNLWAAILKLPGYQRNRTVFFNERQLLNTLKLAFLDIDWDAAPPPSDPAPDRLLPFVEALLMVSELIDSREARTKEGTVAEADRLELYFNANILFNAEGDHVREIVRSHYFYIESHPEITSKGGLSDLAQLLGQVTGLSPDRTWAALFVLYTGFGVLSHDDIDAGRVVLSRRDYLRDLSKLSKAEAERWFSLGTLAVAQMQSAVREQYSLHAPNWFDVLVFEVHPLVSFGDDVLCLSIPLLRKLQSTSLWYRLIDRSVPEETRLRALDTRGRLLEAYVGEILRRSFDGKYFDEKALNECVNPASGARRKGGKSKVCDGLVIIDDIAVLFEVKETSLALDARQATSFAKYEEKRVKLVASAATQLEATAQHLRAGKFASIGVDASTVRHIIPIIVSMDQPVNPTLYRSIREHDLIGNPLYEAMRKGAVEPLQLTTLSDLEFLESIAEKGTDVAQLLLAKGRSSDEVGLAFHQFCHGRTGIDRNNHGAWYGKRYYEIMEEMTMELRSVGMSASEVEAVELQDLQVAGGVSPTNA